MAYVAEHTGMPQREWAAILKKLKMMSGAESGFNQRKAIVSLECGKVFAEGRDLAVRVRVSDSRPEDAPMDVQSLGCLSRKSCCWKGSVWERLRKASIS